jgi:hypothetical protein
MFAYEKKDEKEAPKAKATKGMDTSGSATNVRWSTDKGTLSIRKSVTPSAETQSRSR